MVGALIDVVQWVVIISMIIGILMTRRIGRLEGRAVVHYHQLPSAFDPPPAFEEPKPICGCDHHQCFHDENGCGAQGTKIYNGKTYDYIPCGCKRYTGPEALPTVLP